MTFLQTGLTVTGEFREYLVDLGYQENLRGILSNVYELATSSYLVKVTFILQDKKVVLQLYNSNSTHALACGGSGV